MSAHPVDTVRSVVEAHGRTLADDAGIVLRDRPTPLFQLLVLSLLASTRVPDGTVAAAARALWSAGWQTPDEMLDSTWAERGDALARGGLRHDSGCAASRLAALSERVIDEYGGDLRGLRPETADGVERVRDGVTRFTGIGLTGADVFCREVQQVWPAVGPFFDLRSLEAARRLGLPYDPVRLAALAPDGRVVELAAALLRVA